MAEQRIACVGAVIKDATGRLLLVKRGHEPAAGLWSLPGGRIEPGETDQEAVVREIGEECGLLVRCDALLGAVERPGPGGAVIDIRDYLATVTGGQLQPGDDAADACWVTPAQLDRLDAGGQLTQGLVPVLRSWGVLG